MVGVDAKAIVAAMQNELAFGDGAIELFPGKAMGANILAIRPAGHCLKMAV